MGPSAAPRPPSLCTPLLRSAEIQSRLRMATHGEGGFSVFVGLRGSSQELGLEATNYYIYSDDNLDQMYIPLH